MGVAAASFPLYVHDVQWKSLAFTFKLRELTELAFNAGALI